MNYEVAADKKFPQSWRVEAIDFDGDGDCFVTVFDGPHAEKRAREYAAWKQAEGDTRELKAALEATLPYIRHSKDECCRTSNCGQCEVVKRVEKLLGLGSLKE